VVVVKVKSRYQVTLPPQIHAKARVERGDLFEAKVERRTIALIPKRLIDRELSWCKYLSRLPGHGSAPYEYTERICSPVWDGR
jgi:bifunctional DNA-binding transcriptional regulator/antitoxin component of YhaV-PrlF toxin-antitoxin module